MSRAELVLAHDTENKLDWEHNCWNDPSKGERRTYNISIKKSSTTIIEVNNILTSLENPRGPHITLWIDTDGKTKYDIRMMEETVINIQQVYAHMAVNQEAMQNLQGHSMWK